MQIIKDHINKYFSIISNELKNDNVILSKFYNKLFVKTYVVNRNIEEKTKSKLNGNI